MKVELIVASGLLVFFFMVASHLALNYSPALRKKLIRRVNDHYAYGPLKDAWAAASLGDDWRSTISTDQIRFIRAHLKSMPFEIRRLYRQYVWLRRLNLAAIPIWIGLTYVFYRMS